MSEKPIPLCNRCGNLLDSECGSLEAKVRELEQELQKMRPSGPDDNPRNLSDEALVQLLSRDLCPMCMGNLDTGYECNSCGYDAMPLIKAGKDKR
jgi:hypothetical protein